MTSFFVFILFHIKEFIVNNRLFILFAPEPGVDDLHNQLPVLVGDTVTRRQPFYFSSFI